jgi:hemolysin activation/secretion protein
MGGFSIPPYFLPKSAKIPFSTGTFYNNLKLFTFVEYARGFKKSPQTAADKSGSNNPETAGPADDDRSKSLSSAGCGFQFAIPGQGLSMRMDIGWPLDHKLTKDGDHHHIWYRVTKGF